MSLLLDALTILTALAALAMLLSITHILIVDGLKWLIELWRGE